eukprot:scaffold179512_cov37-Prasinocladus_malaysianus.AAC.1
MIRSCVGSLDSHDVARDTPQATTRVIITLTGPLEQEAKLLEGLQRATAMSSGNPMVAIVKTRLQTLTDLTVLKPAARTSVSFPLAVDTSSATAATLVAVGISKLAANPQTLAFALTQQGITAANDDLE